MSKADATVTYKEIPGFPGYRVGDDGTVWSRWKRVGNGKGRGRGSHFVIGEAWRLLKKEQGNKRGYLRATLVRDGVIHVFALHRLILEVFVGPCSAGMQARHFPDRNPGNCQLKNLRWGTGVENHSDKEFHGTSMKGERHHQAKLTERMVKEIRRRYASGETQLAIAIEFGVGRTNIDKIVRRLIWKHI